MNGTLAVLSPSEAQRLTQRIKLVAGGVRDGLFKLRNLVDEAKNSNVWQVLGFPSWTAYLADTLADEPMRLGRDERQELVGYLAGEGLSTRAIAPIVGASVGTVHADREVFRTEHLPTSTERHDFPTAPEWSPETGFVNESTGEVTAPADVFSTPAEPRVVTGLDGKSYTAPAKATPRRSSLTDAAQNAGWDIRKVADRLKRIADDDRFSRNKDEVATALRGHLMFTVEVCQDLLDTFNQPSED